MSDVKILTGEEARNTVGEILANEPKPGDYVNKEALYPVHLGAVGYFAETLKDGSQVYSAFDNSTGDCWCEDFKTRDGAVKWCRGEMSTDEVHELEKDIDQIILSKSDFSKFLEGRVGDIPNQMPPYVVFDENGEFVLDMDFKDGYAFDTDPYGLGVSDRVALYYPTVAEVAKSAEKQEAIEAYTGRRWAEGSLHEQIYDIALKYGQASRILCPRERFDDAVKAIVERASDPSSKAFTQEQLDRVRLAAACNGESVYSSESFREVFYESLYGHAQQQMRGVPIEWAVDAHEELKQLSRGEVRGEGCGLHL